LWRLKAINSLGRGPKKIFPAVSAMEPLPVISSCHPCLHVQCCQIVVYPAILLNPSGK
jgi:hypothetical protein